jgi:hypothetical protein
MNSKKKINIDTVLSYKENYFLEEVLPVSLLVSEFSKNKEIYKSNKYKAHDIN